MQENVKIDCMANCRQFLTVLIDYIFCQLRPNNCLLLTKTFLFIFLLDVSAANLPLSKDSLLLHYTTIALSHISTCEDISSCCQVLEQSADGCLVTTDNLVSLRSHFIPSRRKQVEMELKPGHTSYVHYTLTRWKSRNSWIITDVRAKCTDSPTLEQVFIVCLFFDSTCNFSCKVSVLCK